jgi:hypothetical protein
MTRTQPAPPYPVKGTTRGRHPRATSLLAAARLIRTSSAEAGWVRAGPEDSAGTERILSGIGSGDGGRLGLKPTSPEDTQ